jgi:Proprotein convertase P-domain
VTINGIMTVETVVLYLDLDSSSRGYLEIRLTSPSGTQSILTPGYSPENTQLPENVRMKLMTLKNWGESSGGEWTLSISVAKPGEDVSTCVDLPLLDDATLASDGSCFRLSTNADALNLTVDEACGKSYQFGLSCCVCGGGQDITDIQDQLKSWTLVVYGRDLIGNLAPTVSPAPTVSDGQYVRSPAATPSEVYNPTTLQPSIAAFRKPTASPSVQSATSPSSTSTGCISSLDDLRDCLATELSVSQINECSTCLQDSLSTEASEVVTTCSQIKDRLCFAFSEACDCGSCSDLYLQYLSCASDDYVVGGCQFECGNGASTTDDGGAVSEGNSTATNGNSTSMSASSTLPGVMLAATVVAVHVVFSLS